VRTDAGEETEQAGAERVVRGGVAEAAAGAVPVGDGQVQSGAVGFSGLRW